MPLNERPRLLIVSFSDISADARVKKQVNLFAEEYAVTTCGFGPAFREGVEHIRIEPRETPFTKRREAALLRTHLYAAAYALSPAVRAARRALADRRFDAAIANDIDALGVTERIVGSDRTHADLHEFFPGLHDQVPAWNRIRRPFLEWLIRRDATRAASATTVSQTIADRYATEFGVVAGVVQNAAPLMHLEPLPVGDPIRMVHSGGAQTNRRIEVMMEAAARTETNLTFDLFLTGEGTEYANSLRELADSLGDRVTVHPPVPQGELVPLLNGFDVGIHILPATNTNNALALPNKFFDYVQARLGLVIGPTADMARLAEEYEIGSVADGFDVESVVGALDALDRGTIEKWKRNADAAAPRVSAEAQQHVWVDAVRRIAGRSPLR